MGDKTYYIYALVEPTSREIRYIGASLHPATRLKEHVHCATSKTMRRRSSTGDWIRELAASGLSPEMMILEKFIARSVQSKNDIEAEWIWHFRDMDVPLLNRHPALRHKWHSGKSQVLNSSKY